MAASRWSDRRSSTASATPSNLVVHHIGNNRHHGFVHERVARDPGVVVLHDLVLHHFYAEDKDKAAYRERLGGIHGERGHGLALANLHDVSSELAFFVFPLFERLVAASRGVIVHNQRSAEAIRRRVPRVPVACVPMGIPEASTDPLPPREEARRGLGIDAGELLVGMFGFVTPMKRPLIVMRAFAAALGRLGAARLVIVGDVSDALDLEAEAQALGIAERVVLTGYLPYAEVKRWVAAADVFVNLRYPTAGETSASLVRLLSWEKTVLVSDYGQFRDIPEDTALRVPLGPSEEPELVELLVLLAERPDLARGFARRAAAHTAREHTLEGAAQAYVDFFEEVVRRPFAGPRTFVEEEQPRTSRTPRAPRARLIGGDLPRGLRVGRRLEVPVRAENVGDTIWLGGRQPFLGRVALGAYLRGPDGRRVVRLPDTPLPRDVMPGDEVTVGFDLEVPGCEGDFELVLGVRIAGYGWLHARGSEALVWPITIRGR